MKIVIATPLYPPEIGGPATYVKILEEELPKRGIEVEVVKFSDVRHLPKIVRHYLYYRRVYKEARGADAILALDPVSVGWPARKAARCLNVPLIVKIVGDYAWEQGQQRFGVTEALDEFVKKVNVPFPVRLLRNIQENVARSATKIIVPSEYLKSIVQSWGIPGDKIQVIYNAVLLDAPGRSPADVTALARPLVVSVGRLVPWKRMSGVIQAVTQARAQGAQASLAIVGGGPDRASLMRIAHEKLGAACVLTGVLSHMETLAIMKEADVFVLNSSYEGFSHVLIEALSLGIAIIATRIGGNPEIITDGKNGILIPAGDTVALTKALTNLLGDADRRATLQRAARESADHFSKETMLRKTATLLTTL